MKTGAIVAAAVGALLGAIIWAVISATTGYEVAYVAWGIGLLVGFGAKAAGGEGKSIGVMCALLALVAIFCGKVFAVQYTMPGEIRKLAEEEYPRSLYDEITLDAADFAEVSSEEEYPAFMVAHGYSAAEHPEGVTAEELAEFKEYWVEDLRAFHADQPTFEEWREHAVESAVDLVMANLPITQAVVEDLGLLDILFAVLGLATAYKVGSGLGTQDTHTSA